MTIPDNAALAEQVREALSWFDTHGGDPLAVRPAHLRGRRPWEALTTLVERLNDAEYQKESWRDSCNLMRREKEAAERERDKWRSATENHRSRGVRWARRSQAAGAEVARLRGIEEAARRLNATWRRRLLDGGGESTQAQIALRASLSEPPCYCAETSTRNCPRHAGDFS